MAKPSYSRRSFAQATIAVSASLYAPLLLAQEVWPSKSVKLIIPFPAGGATDTLGRVLAQAIAADLGQPVIVENRLGAAGAITIGKTNTPEFATGSQTFNAVFGATLNPYDLTRTCGGSSGGAAVSVACGMLPFADGSDLGASLRNPGNFCNVVY